VREEETLRMMEYIKEHCSSASLLNLTELCSTITDDIICRVAFGKRYREGIRGMKFQEVMLEFGELLGTVCIGDYIPWLDWLGKANGFYTRAEKCAKYLDEFIEQIIEEHISVDGEDQNDFVDVLLSVQKTNDIGFPIDRTAIKALILVSNSIILIYMSSFFLLHICNIPLAYSIFVLFCE
jgi:cytochrome P450